MNQTESETSGEFIKRKFSLTHEADNLIDELAETQHGGNRSAAVRQAVLAQIQRRDEEELRHGLQRLQNDIQALTEQVEKLQDRDAEYKQPSRIQQAGNNRLNTNVSQTGNRSNTVSGSGSDARTASEVFSAMSEQDQEIYSIDDLVSSVDYSLEEVVAGIKKLVQEGAIAQVSPDEETTFQLTNS